IMIPRNVSDCTRNLMPTSDYLTAARCRGCACLTGPVGGISEKPYLHRRSGHIEIVDCWVVPGGALGAGCTGPHVGQGRWNGQEAADRVVPEPRGVPRAPV